MSAITKDTLRALKEDHGSSCDIPNFPEADRPADSRHRVGLEELPPYSSSLDTMFTLERVRI
ncbi:hypothetical protein EYF80_002022 [Liparis tanakae]|uniref:Uncharacterized protein n=1 Tax=Liparis tanakae TaxID=230148 RepID=A0A4Z2JBH5_9TELE|nr:hypothetical protein EYF80_002022 [Liparis tanakae]